jgi:pyruvate,water dikinase
MEQMMGVSSALPSEVADRLAPKPGGALAWMHLAWSLGRLIAHAIRLPGTIAAFQQRLDAALANCAPSGDLKTLANRYRELELSLLDRWDAPLINDFLCMIAFGASRALLRRWCGNDELHNELMIGQGNIISAEPARRIRRMAAMLGDDPAGVAALRAGDVLAAEARPKLHAAIVDYLQLFGDRCTQELKLESLTLDDDPTPLLQAIGHAAGHLAVASSSSKNSLQRALAGHPLRLAIAAWMVGWAKARVRDRENLRLQRTRVFGRVRRIFLEIGRRMCDAGLLGQPRDIFFLEVGEVLGLIEGTATLDDPNALVALRRDRVPNPSPPNRFWTYGAVCHSRRQSVDTPAPIDGDRRQGLGCCPGIVRAPVRVIVDPRRESLKSGEILVARHTDPGWIALFSGAAGVVVERGSLLSHSAIVAREMAIPAVVAVPGLLDWLKTGDLVELNGRAGTVVKLSHETQPA